MAMENLTFWVHEAHPWLKCVTELMLRQPPCVRGKYPPLCPYPEYRREGDAVSCRLRLGIAGPPAAVAGSPVATALKWPPWAKVSNRGPRVAARWSLTYA
ncbi:hypothetical protein GCM10010358_74150 [Streptomyces minutiscleroticus]|uniref:Uncharacterized protein n=1 Tax=Streptomyces minutiscleroticus TaxID=68238 RepID=A0A918U8N2_9ACTN|nr:hypothetical protein GCM10010358_74150 [Streptomyces minutiscleroticus]